MTNNQWRNFLVVKLRLAGGTDDHVAIFNYWYDRYPSKIIEMGDKYIQQLMQMTPVQLKRAPKKGANHVS